MIDTIEIGLIDLIILTVAVPVLSFTAGMIVQQIKDPDPPIAVIHHWPVNMSRRRPHRD